MLTPQSTYADLKGFFPFEPTEDQDVLLKKLALYLSVKRILPEVLIVKGYAGTGKNDHSSIGSSSAQKAPAKNHADGTNGARGEGDERRIRQERIYHS